MADLAKVSVSPDARRRSTDNQDYVLPSRRNTDAPNIEVNAPIRRPSDNSAEILARTLGLVTDAATQIGQNAYNKAEDKRGGQGTLDAQLGQQDPSLFAKSHAYRTAYQIESAKSGAFTLDQNVTKMVEDRLSDPDNPATLDDIHKIIDDAFSGYALDPATGKARDFGNGQAALAVAQQLAATRERLMSGAYKIIGERQDSDTLDKIGGNVINELLQGPIKTIPGAPQPITLIDPNDGLKGDPTKPGAVTAKPAPVSGTSTPLAAPAGESRTLKGGKIWIKGSGVPVDDAKSVVKDLFPQARITDSRRPADSNLGRANPNSFHVKTNAAVDIAPIKGVSFESYVQKYRDAGYSIIEAFEEVGAGRSKNATGDHWHLVLGKPGTGSAGALADASTGDGGASLTPVNEPGKAAPTAPPLDFEATMARVPPTIERGKAKQYLLGLFLNAADENNKPEWLDALWRSTRKDGTPSFNPEEITKIRAERDQIRERMRVEANQVQTKKWQDNADVILKGVVDGNPASRETIRTWVDRGDLDPSFGYSYINNLDAEDRRAAAEAKADSRQAQAEAENDIDYGLATDIEAYRMGVFNGSTYDSDQKRFSDGELGTGKKAAARLRALNAARTAGEKLLTENPEAVAMAARINQFYKPKSAGGGGASLVEKALGASNGNKPYDYSVPIMAEYKKLLKAGEDPSHAYVAAVGKYGPKDNADVQRMARERLQYLQRKAAGR